MLTNVFPPPAKALVIKIVRSGWLALSWQSRERKLRNCSAPTAFNPRLEKIFTAGSRDHLGEEQPFLRSSSSSVSVAWRSTTFTHILASARVGAALLDSASWGESR